MDDHQEIDNLDLPIARLIRTLLADLSPNKKLELLNKSSEDEFINHRVQIYLDEITKAISAGYDETGAKEIALEESLVGLK